MNKIFPSASDAVADLRDGAVLLVGGFGLCGNLENLIAAVHDKGVKHLTLVSNNCGTTDLGLGVLLKARQVRKIVASYVGENKEFERQYLIAAAHRRAVRLRDLHGSRVDRRRCGRAAAAGARSGRHRGAGAAGDGAEARRRPGLRRDEALSARV